MSFLACAETATKQPQADVSDAVIAEVGDQPITMNLLNTMLNSSAIVGLSIPALGTPKRDRVRLQLLDKAVSANLLYLDALDKGVDKDPAYQQAVSRFQDAILAMQYRKKYVIGDLEVTDEEIQEFFNNRIAPGTEFTDEVRTAIEASIRKERVQGRTTTMRIRLREGTEVVINEDHLDPAADAGRRDTEVVASIDDQPVLWGEVKEVLGTPSNAGSMESRINALNRLIDHRILAQKGKAAGLDQDPVYQTRVAEFKKARLINLHRGQLSRKMQPTEQELQEYFEQNKNRITVSELRKVQMVVLDTSEKAEDVKQKIASGEITIYEAAIEYSIDPNAEKTLGVIGWVSKGTGFPELDQVTFALEPGELGGPIQSPNGWHLVKVLDLRAARHEDLENENTRKLTQRMLVHGKLNDYVIKLRKEKYPVVVYGDKINELFKAEARWMAAKLEKAARTTKDEEKLKKQIEDLMNVQ
jgi:parvulin-like peptidyl-prolyl isomerase